MSNDDELYERGYALRRKFIGPEVLDPLIDGMDDFDRPYHRLVTEVFWGTVWDRLELDDDLKLKLSFVLMLAVNRADDGEAYARQLLRRGTSFDELRAIIIHCALYVGFPRAIAAIQTVKRIHQEINPTAQTSSPLESSSANE